jgi:hypothetical protein
VLRVIAEENRAEVNFDLVKGLAESEQRDWTNFGQLSLATSRCKIALPSREQTVTEPCTPKQNNQILFGIVSVA